MDPNSFRYLFHKNNGFPKYITILAIPTIENFRMYSNNKMRIQSSFKGWKISDVAHVLSYRSQKYLDQPVCLNRVSSMTVWAAIS